MNDVEIALRIVMTAETNELNQICYTLNEVCSSLEAKLRGGRSISYKMYVDGEDYKGED